MFVMDDGSGDGQSLPGPSPHLFSGKKGVKDSILDRIGDPSAGVGKSNNNFIFLLAAFNADTSPFSPLPLLHRRWYGQY